MVDQPLLERLETLMGWDDMLPEEKYEACRQAGLLVLLNKGVGAYTYVELEGESKTNREDLEDTLGYYITDPDDPTADYFNISDIDQLSGDDVMPLLCDLFPELEATDEADFDDWLRAFIHRTRLGHIAGQRTSTT
ncbi:hypothetical protein [Pseudoxanthomonas kaohsiungensis]|uniref:Uncharacterized protein n=1 Tax=Pseudoxanthomonas kaohsiungensis TaxID=283923 RepID=A0ABW3LZJ8_9GAMM|nr:hypothetical protein [Pseudoxanthomonas kaohsiungensis]KAF1701148.1 hypothetical protein CSC66_13910 [Pseudoxanthomonas kaohsiungensis]